ncbi:MAG: three-Cys-motif partner protein TcmP [Phycisphaerae bacterium]|jgi:three-Cys-motif partner protein
MSTHAFGGDWTTDKLERLRKYLCAYTTIFTKNLKARYFITIYVDAFAGTGYRVNSATRKGAAAVPDGDTDPDPEADLFRKGSARIALDVVPSFNRYIFVERDSIRVSELETLRANFPGKDVQIEQGDANFFLKEWCGKTNWKKHRAVVFLDPYGMQVEWQTLEALARTQAIDLWILFPLGVAVNRLLTRESPPPAWWAKTLTRIFGTPDWEQAFYPKIREETLFGPEETQRKDAPPHAIGRYFLERLKTIFGEVAPNPLPLRNSTNTPIYLLCFASANPKGGRTAVKIARHILKP